jgi:hypothetical protein
MLWIDRIRSDHHCLAADFLAPGYHWDSARASLTIVSASCKANGDCHDAQIVDCHIQPFLVGAYRARCFRFLRCSRNRGRRRQPHRQAGMRQRLLCSLQPACSRKRRRSSMHAGPWLSAFADVRKRADIGGRGFEGGSRPAQGRRIDTALKDGVRRLIFQPASPKKGRDQWFAPFVLPGLGSGRLAHSDATISCRRRPCRPCRWWP